MPGIQYWFSGTALAAFLALLAAASSLGYGWYRAAITEMEAAASKIETAAQRARREQVKDLLGNAISSANQLLQQLMDREATEVEKHAEAWGQRTHDLIVAAYGNGEAELFLDSSGYVFYSDGSEKRSDTQLDRRANEAHYGTAPSRRQPDRSKGI
jgi:hypothetical protein